MIAAKSPLETVILAGIPTPTRRCSTSTVCLLNLRIRSVFEGGREFAVSANWSKMELLRKMGGGCCFKERATKGQKLEVESVSGGEDVLDAATTEEKVCPEHLVVMVNGIIGSSADWRYAAEQFVKKLPDKVIVHRSESNYSKLTLDGVDLMGERLAEEVLDVVRRRPKLRKISFVAHSLGGLVARYAVGRLYSHSPKTESFELVGSCFSEEHTNHSLQSLEQPLEDRIAGLEPMNFITFATPHLGSRGHRQLPLLCGLPLLEKSASQTAHWIAGRSGKHLFLTDNDDGKPPLLLQMVNDSNDLKFMSALRSFKRRVAYANVNYDHVVGWSTSSIRRQHELPKANLLVKDEKYPHIVYDEQEITGSIHSKECSSVGDQIIELEEEMIRGLTQVPWERVDVSFRKSKQRYIAHSTIQAEDSQLIIQDVTKKLKSKCYDCVGCFFQAVMVVQDFACKPLVSLLLLVQLYAVMVCL